MRQGAKFMPPWSAGQLLVRCLALAVFVGALTLLYLSAETVSHEQHFIYTQDLRDLRELDARIDLELLASRLEQIHNYDGLANYMQRSAELAARQLDAPVYLAAPDRLSINDSVEALRSTLERKAVLVDRFMRDNSVVRNSMAFFPVAVSDFLEGRGRSRPSRARGDLVGRYARQILAFAHSLSQEDYRELLLTRARLGELTLNQTDSRQLVNIVRHGDVISQRLVALDLLMRDIAELHSADRMEKIRALYTAAYGRAMTLAGYYRSALYVLAVALTAFLAWLFTRLEYTRRSLAKAHREVTTRHAAQREAEKQLNLHATAFQNAHDGITLTDAQGNILDVNPAFTRITGWERSEVIGCNPRILKSGRHDEKFYAAMWQSIKRHGNWRGEVWNCNRNGDVYPELLSISAVRNEVGQLTNYVAVFSDIGRIKSQEKQLEMMAYYDALTELPNRVLLLDRLVQGIAQTRRSHALMAICYLDLDGFKPINDTWGHEAGDNVLIDIANRMNAALRGGDTVARLGGDEFVLLLMGLASPEECENAVRRMLDQIALPLTIQRTTVNISASAGVTLFPLDNQDPDTLLRHADQAMYRAKLAGKNCYHLFDAEQDRTARTRQDQMARIRQGLEEREFELYYQPKVNMRQGTVIGAEALIRWNHPVQGVLPPSEFLPLIEDDDLSLQLGDWVIETALLQMEAWRAMGLELAVSVNVAGRQLQAPEFVDKLRVALFLHPSVAHQLGLEILETAALDDVVKTAKVIDECRAMGVHFDLDDFGTGYSSLTYLKRLSAQTIKIDQSFVREILGDFNSAVIVQAVIGLASAFQRQTIAEGVETVEHGRLLIQLNCDYGQGYGIARPMPAAEVAAWVGNWQPDVTWQEIRHRYWRDADYPMLLAEISLRHWIDQWTDALSRDERSMQSPLSALEPCGFCAWQDGPGRPSYDAYPDCLEVDRAHRHLHEITGKIQEFWCAGAVDAARKMLPALFLAHAETLGVLHRLQLAVAVGEL